ncbi:DUF4118 domain-containing protein [Streptomyces silvisoli]|uniref:DUF4118 domain-containing protein n=1 Tax=Streptomyces silvisoli TaxID=3034235 RepID=A0ABT5ZHI3_9ACTN|nr:DUF4118 domain-containing protein [Streptomyces silvisoli]MDF3289131.1 DUF4118 domain-containing protein [Streptomyces silvisoli]
MASVHWVRVARRGSRPRTLIGDLVLPVGYASAAVLAAALALGGGRGHPWFSMAVFAVLTAGVAAQTTRMVWAPAVAVVCWLFFDGFLVNRQGELAWRSTDRAGLVVLLVAALVGAVAAALDRRRNQ